MATFPLVPYSNRVGFGRFDWNGENYRLAANFPPEAHAIHGTGWTMPWQAEPDGTNAVTLRCVHVPNADWPWPFEAEQRITLSAYTLHIELTARNLSDQPVPLAFGHHPYFDNEGATLSFAAEQVWRTGSDGLPAFAETPQGMFDFTRGDPVQTRILDNGFAGWDGKAHIRWDGRPLTLEIEADVQAAVVYVPEDSNYFCFEPVPHIINALNLPGHMPQMPVVAPGAAYEAQIRFKAEPA
jgi:aldose 1-epimerase